MWQLSVITCDQVQDPYIDLDREGGAIVAAVMALLATESAPNRMKKPEPKDPKSIATGLGNSQTSAEKDEFLVA